MTFAQIGAVAQDHPVMTFATVGGALLTGFIAAGKWAVKRVENAFTSLTAKVEGHDQALTTSIRETSVRFSQIESEINNHRVEMLTAFQRHADFMTVPLAEVQLQAHKNALRIDALYEINERRKAERDDGK